MSRNVTEIQERLVNVSRPLTTDRVVRHYLHAKRIVIESGFASEITWQHSVRIEDATEVSFLREAAWVVLSSGMRETVIRNIFPRLADVFHAWRPGMVTADPNARTRALHIYHHKSKIEAIVTAAGVAQRLGPEGVRYALAHEPDTLFDALPYIGPVTRRHLAKNLGVALAKPDRHLARLAVAAGRCGVDDLCQEISDWVGDAIHVVDIVLWRWATLHQRMCTYSLCEGLPHPEP